MNQKPIPSEHFIGRIRNQVHYWGGLALINFRGRWPDCVKPLRDWPERNMVLHVGIVFAFGVAAVTRRNGFAIMRQLSS